MKPVLDDAFCSFNVTLINLFKRGLSNSISEAPRILRIDLFSGAANKFLRKTCGLRFLSSVFLPIIKPKFLKADYPPRFLNRVIRQFSKKCNSNTQDDYIIPPDFFGIPKPLILVEIPYCPRNETRSERFIKKFHELTNNSHEIRIKCITTKVK